MTELEVKAFLRRELETPRLVQFADHIAECESCREKLAQHKDAVPAKSSIEQDLENLADHISEEDLQQYIAGKLDLVRIQAIDGHLIRCPQCKEEVRDLRSFAASAPSLIGLQARRPNPLARAGIIMIVAMAVAAVLFW